MKPYTQHVSLTDRKKKTIEKHIQKTLRDLRSDPDNYTYQIEIGDSYCALEDYERAEQHYTAAIELLHQAPFQEKASKHIIMLYGKILNFAPEREEAHLKLGEAYIAAGHPEKASRFLLSSAKKAIDNENYELALKCYNKVIEMGKSTPSIIERTTELYLKLGQKQEAVANYIQIGELFEQEEKHLEALGYYKKAHTLDPEDTGIIEKIAGAYQTIGWTENAAGEFLKVAAHFEQQNNYAQAMTYYRHSLKLDPENQKAQMGTHQMEQEISEIEEKEAAHNLSFDDQDILEELNAMEECLEKQKDRPESVDGPETIRTDANTDIEFISEELLNEASDQQDSIVMIGDIIAQEEEAAKDHAESSSQEELLEVTDDMFVHELPSKEYVTMEQLLEKVEELEKHLQSTQEEKFLLQEQFTAQIAQMKEREVSIVQELENISDEKQKLEQRVTHINGDRPPGAGRDGDAETSHEDRYEAIIEKIQQRKQTLREQLHSLLQQREENTRAFTRDLNDLSSTKQRLQQNLTYIQHVKAHLEEKVNGELRQAKQEVETLTRTSEDLQQKLHNQQQLEQDLRSQFEKLHQEKISLEDQFTETVSALTGENESLEAQVEHLKKEKQSTETTLKKKCQALHRSYHQLKEDYTHSIQSKEQELEITAQRLHEFGEKYVNLEKTLSDIRQERDKLEAMLHHETATREMLEEKLCDIEVQVDSLETHGTELLQEFGQELDRQFSLEQGASEEFASSLDELEKLLALQEQEIQSLEAI